MKLIDARIGCRDYERDYSVFEADYLFVLDAPEEIDERYAKGGIDCKVGDFSDNSVREAEFCGEAKRNTV